MTDDQDPLNDSIRRALAAAEAATDAAQEADGVVAGQKAIIAELQKGQRLAVRLAIGAVVGAVLSVTVAGLVYSRSVADLREASDLQAASTKLLVEKLLVLNEGLDKLAKSDVAMKADVTALGDKIGADLKTITDASAAAPPPPDNTAMLQDGLDKGLAALRTDVLAAIGDLDLHFTETMAKNGAPASPDVAALTDLLKQTLDRLPAKSGSAAPAKPAAPSGKSGAGKSGSDKTKAAAPAFSYP